MTNFAMTVTTLLALTLTGLTQADTPPATPTPAKATDGAITDAQLGEMLTNLGMEPKPGTYKSGAQYYDVKVVTKDYDLNVRLGLSPNKRSIWLMAYLGDLPANVPVERLKGLLEAINSKTGKMQFRLTGNQLKADQPLDNVGVTPARLRRELDDFGAALQETGHLWDNTKAVPKVAAQAEKGK